MALAQALSILRKEEQALTRRFEKQLAGIRNAIASLEFGGAVSPSLSGRSTRVPTAGTRKKRKLSKASRARMAAAQKARWAKVKAAKRA